MAAPEKRSRAQEDLCCQHFLSFFRASQCDRCMTCFAATGKRGLDALTHLDLPQVETGGRAVASINPSSPSGTSGSSSSSSSASDSIAGLWAPGSAGLGHLTTPAATVRQPGDASGQGHGSSFKELNPEPLPGLTLLQGMVVLGPQGARREEYSRAASKSKPAQGSAVPGGMTAGIGELLAQPAQECCVSTAALLAQMPIMHTSRERPCHHDASDSRLLIASSMIAVRGMESEQLVALGSGHYSKGDLSM